MNARLKKLFAAAALGTLTLSLTFGANADDVTTLRIFVIEDAPNNTDLAKQFWDAFNEKLEADMNMRVEYNYAAGNDFRNNYALAIASGEKYDLMMSANGWLDYSDYANKNAFMVLDDLIPENAPYIWENISDEAWDCTKVNGHIYAVPNLDMNMCASTFIYREDLRKKYDLPEIKSMDDIETYLQCIKDNEPGLLPSDDYQCQVYGTSWIETTRYIGIDELHDKIYNFVYDPETGEVLSVIETPEYKEFMYKMKDWADRGFWPSDVLASTNWGVMQVLSGVAASSFNEQLPNYNFHATQAETEHADEGWEIGFFMFFTANDEAEFSYMVTDPMFSIPNTAQNPEKALQFLDYVQQDEEAWDMLTYGLEGVNYNLVDGKIDVSDIAEGADYNYFTTGLVANKNYKKVKTNYWKNYEEMMDTLESRATVRLFDGFVLDRTNFDAEYTALNNAQMEYGYPLQAGLVNDVDAAYDQYLAAAKAAGLDMIKEEITAQVNAYLEGKK